MRSMSGAIYTLEKDPVQQFRTCVRIERLKSRNSGDLQQFYKLIR